MSFMPATIAAYLAGRTPRIAVLSDMSFRGLRKRVFVGAGTLVAGDGTEWTGIGETIGISGLETPSGGNAPKVTVTLSGVDPSLMSRFPTAASDVKGRRIRFLIQCFSEDGNPLDVPLVIWTGLMDVLSAGGEGPAQRVLELSCETIFARRAISAFGYLSHEDQARRSTGDRGLEQIPAMANKVVQWPVF